MDVLQKYKLRALRRTDRLTIAVVLLGAIILLGLITYKRPTRSYQITVEQMLEAVAKDSHMILPDRLPLIVENEKYKIIDCRNSLAYTQGHIETAIHIPKHDLLNPKSLSLFDDHSITFILYGNSTSGANSLWMLLKQLGYENIKVLAGGFTKESNNIIHPNVTKYDYNKLMHEATTRNRITFGDNATESKKKTTKKILPKKKAKKHHTDGGC